MGLREGGSASPGAPEDGPSPGARLKEVQRAIADACARAGRPAGSVTLVAVSKTVPLAAIDEVITAGQAIFGENRVQEARAKWPPLLARFGHVEVHLIGPLQTNKVREAAGLFTAIHSLDRPALCEALVRERARRDRLPMLFVQVNTGAEPQKAGVLPEDADVFLAACRERYGLDIAGLMCIPPVSEPPAPHFEALAGIAARNGLSYLSMGMSADFGLAIEYGATHVRVGTAVFGPRQSTPPRAEGPPRRLD
ncbi:MAG TPA: YggS family pyridoxal phosphate-dependent enzyme [Streptosporangiaceae bacterium]|nr:YggS family pyridoxal phosphate-dependent enzyme [Streptosporangiaceae bacterium]